MAKKKAQPAAQEALPAVVKAQTVKLPVPDGWYDLTIGDVDPAYHSQTSPAVFVVLKLRMLNSLRYKDRSFSLYIGENMEGTFEGRTFPSQRAQIIERFGIDPWSQPDALLDLVVRGHVVVRTSDDGKQNNAVTSIYPKVARDTSRPNDEALQEEIRF